jgi:hypothetical protein
VIDAFGNAVANATVTATSIDNGQMRSAASGTDGSYKFEGLPPGNYRLKFEAAGWGNPSNQGIGPHGGRITSEKFFQNNTPDARFLQSSLKSNSRGLDRKESIRFILSDVTAPMNDSLNDDLSRRASFRRRARDPPMKSGRAVLKKRYGSPQSHGPELFPYVRKSHRQLAAPKSCCRINS